MKEFSVCNSVHVALTICGAQPHPSHPPLLLPMTVLLRRVSGSESRANCLYSAPLYRVNKMKFQDDFGYPY